MYLVEAKPMPGNNPMAGVKTGLWRVMFTDIGQSDIIPQNPPLRTHAENLSYEEAIRIAKELKDKLNSNF